MSRTTVERPDPVAQQPPSNQEPPRTVTDGVQMTKRQCGCLNRQLRERGLNQSETEAWLCQAANIDAVGELTKRQASVLIECLFRLTDLLPIPKESEAHHD